MPKKYFAAVLLLVILLLVSCAKTEPLETLTEGGALSESKETETREEPAPSTETKEDTATNDNVEPPIQTEPSTTTKPHVHAYSVKAIQKPTCMSEGKQIWSCSCGETKTEILSVLSHEFSEANCTSPQVCANCGVQQGERLGHSLQGNTCTRCKKKVTAPIYVLGTELLFDEPREGIQQKLGTPTETITEGGFVSLVYASSPLELTIIQTDSVGLWGVFTIDPTAVFFPGERNVSVSNFSGTKDLNSDAYYQDVGSCRVFGFKDHIKSGAYYGMWLRYSECRYDYMNDPALATSYYGQSRLSWYYVNSLRAINGLSPLAWSDAAAKVATDYSAVMAALQLMEHDGSFGERLKKEGVLWRYAGENISQGYFNLYFVCDAYYNSLGHRENLLNDKFTHVGMGFCQTTLGQNVFGAQIFYS